MLSIILAAGGISLGPFIWSVYLSNFGLLNMLTTDSAEFLKGTLVDDWFVLKRFGLFVFCYIFDVANGLAAYFTSTFVLFFILSNIATTLALGSSCSTGFLLIIALSFKSNEVSLVSSFFLGSSKGFPKRLGGLFFPNALVEEDWPKRLPPGGTELPKIFPDELLPDWAVVGFAAKRDDIADVFELFPY